jgi:hypothetical protein
VTDAPHAGEARVTLGGQGFVVVYDWRAFSALGKAGFIGLESLSPYDAERLAEIFAIGLARHHPDMTAARIMEMSPPFLLVIDAVARAIGYALAGPGGARDADPQNPAATSPAGI